MRIEFGCVAAFTVAPTTLSPACFSTGMGSPETMDSSMLLAPLILDWWPLGRWPAVRPGGVLIGGGRRKVRLLLLEKLPLLALASAAGA